MKHILSLLLIGCITQVNAQNLTGKAYSPDGGLVQIPLTLYVEFDGCPQANTSLEFIGGTFNLNVVNPLSDCDSMRVHLSGEANARDGVSTIDLVKIVKHILGHRPFTNFLQLIAADANNSQSVSALDIVEIRKLIIGTYQTWPNKKSLQFFVKTTPFAPPVQVTYLPSVKAFPYPGGPWNVDFWVVKTGDIK